MKREFTSNYEKKPLKAMEGWQAHAWKGFDAIVKELDTSWNDEDVLVLDCYGGVDPERVREKLIDPLKPDQVWFCEKAKLPESELYEKIAANVTEDRVFGVMSDHTMEDFYDPNLAEKMRTEIGQAKGRKIIYGTGAGYVWPEGKLVFLDINRWEIQLRYRKGLDNWGAGNYDEDILRKYKRGYFLEWRVFDRHKFSVFDRISYFVDANKDEFSMIDKELLEASLDAFASEPFRLIPYFDEGVWGGTWMEQVCDLKPSGHNYAWCFDGVPEENAIGIRIGDIEVQMPAMNLVRQRPQALLGQKVYERFGAEFPIRFDFLDTMGGQNLSLQVHPKTRYIKEIFGMGYTQDESYYFLDAGPDACVYLGVKNGVTPETLIPALQEAEKGEMPFEDYKYINCFPVKKHDHILIPAGTIHASGANGMVLEISATPYIFTFKLWDWGRLGLDGKPRPINVKHGSKNIDYSRTTDWCRENLVNDIRVLHEEEGLKIEKTGLHELEFIETRRYWFAGKIKIPSSDSVQMLNLVQGEAIMLTGDFDPMIIHYAETFIIPQSVQKVFAEPLGLKEGEKAGLIQAVVRV